MKCFSPSIYISGNPGIATFLFNLNFDNTKLTPVSITKGPALTSGSIVSNVQIDSSLSELKYVTAQWLNPSNIKDDGILYKVKFKINNEVVGDNIPISITYTEGNLVNQAFENVNLLPVDGLIILKGSIIGDVFSDGVINAKDALKLSQYLAGIVMLTESELEAADIFTDGKVDSKDALKLAQYLAGWANVILGTE